MASPSSLFTSKNGTTQNLAETFKNNLEKNKLLKEFRGIVSVGVVVSNLSILRIPQYMAGTSRRFVAVQHDNGKNSSLRRRYEYYFLFLVL